MDDIKLSPRQREKAIEELKIHFSCERDVVLGDLEADMFLDFIVKKIGPSIYNQAIEDSQEFMTQKIDDMFGIML